MASTSNGSNTSVVENFCQVTGSDEERARKILEVCNWDLEMAINMHVDGDGDFSAGDTAAGSEEGVRAPIPQSRGILVEEDVSYNYGIRGRKRRPHSVFDGFRDFRAEAELQEQQSQETLKKRKTLEDLFRPPLDLMHRGNFESARDLGQASNRWLLVNIQDAQEFSCQVLNRDVWSNEAVKHMVGEHFVFWQVYSDSRDGERYMQFYKPEKFPYIAVIDPRTGEKLIEWNNVDATSLLKVMTMFLGEHRSLDGSGTTVQADLPFSVLDQTEDEQLKAALEASLKDSKPINIEDVESDLETFDSDSESMAASSNVNTNHFTEMIDVVGENVDGCQKKDEKEVNSWKELLGAEEDPKSDLVLRLPDGKREQISWPCSTKVKALLLYIAEMGFDPNQYELVTNFPRRNLCQIDVYKTLKEIDLLREMIIVQLKS